jgi:hypothetical protein
LTIADVIASLHTTPPGCIACIVRNAGIARIARNDRNACNDEVTAKDSRHRAIRSRSRLPNVYTGDRRWTFIDVDDEDEEFVISRVELRGGRACPGASLGVPQLPRAEQNGLATAAAGS